MSSRLRRRCTGSPTCPNPAGPGGKCPDHARAADADRNRRRTTSLEVYRSARWRRLRKQILLERTYCEIPDCTRLATDVDHEIRVELRPDLAFSEANLTALCHPHHSSKTARETGFGGRHE